MPSIAQLEDLQEVLGFSFDEIREKKEEEKKEETYLHRKIAVAGTGYVGMSIAVLLAQHNKVIAVDIVKEKVDLINKKIAPIKDDYLEDYLKNKELDLFATLDPKTAYSDAQYVIVAAPTNYDPQKNYFDTSAVEDVIALVRQYNKEAYIIIKSTIPVAYTKKLRERLNDKRILFSPEFLRESKALYDNLYPSRIIVGTDMDDQNAVKAANEFAQLLLQGAIRKDVPIRIMGSSEAEAVKL
ncbi:MAG: UDP-glucose 6-dehydrogenase, partial [Erysipelotrichaceae bacterium]|nr:UDP-glucose 6-dehydrogenase [Erysipelotrichaceae bacterium]